MCFKIGDKVCTAKGKAVVINATDTYTIVRYISDSSVMTFINIYMKQHKLMWLDESEHTNEPPIQEHKFKVGDKVSCYGNIGVIKDIYAKQSLCRIGFNDWGNQLCHIGEVQLITSYVDNTYQNEIKVKLKECINIAVDIGDINTTHILVDTLITLQNDWKQNESN